MLGKIRVEVRPLRKLNDIREVSRLESRHFTYPWDFDDFNRVSECSNYALVGLFLDDILKGYVCWKSYQDSIFIESILLDRTIQREGYGTGLIQLALLDLKETQHHVLALVRETNLEAQLFFKKLGFRVTKVLKDYYEDCSEDGYLFEIEASSTEQSDMQGILELHTTLSDEVLHDVYQDKS